MAINSEINLAVEYIQQGQVGKVEEICKNILASYPFHADALHFLGVTALQQGHPDRALKLIDQAIRIDSHPLRFLGRAGKRFCAAKKRLK